MAEQMPADQNGQNQLPPEIWALIFNRFNGPEPKFLVGLRLICQFWRKVIDEKICFRINANPAFFVNRYSHLRVNDFRLGDLCGKVKVTHLIWPFSDPKLVTKFTLDVKRPIKPSDFFALLSEFTNLEELSVKCFTKGLMEVYAADEVGMRLEGQTSLVPRSKVPEEKNIHQVFEINMPKLTNLSLVPFKFDLDEPCLMQFLTDRAPKLKSLSIKCTFNGKDPKNKLVGSSPKQTRSGPVQLDTLNLGFGDVWHPFSKISWPLLIKQQKSLKQLRVDVGNPVFDNPDFFFDFTNVEETLACNSKTLNLLDLTNVFLSGPLKNGLFQSMTSLHTLVIRLSMGTDQAFNLAMLPSSIQKLTLSGFSRGQASGVVDGENLKNLKHFEMNGINVAQHYKTDFLFPQIMSVELPNLLTLSLKFDKFSLHNSGILPFLLERAPKLKSLQVNCVADYIGYAASSSGKQEMDKRMLHLTELSLELTQNCDADNWLPIVKLQRSLEKLQIRHRHANVFTPICPANCFKFSDLEETIGLNSRTLRDLEILMFKLSAHLNAAMFQEMTNLENLTLKHHFKYSGSQKFKILNLHLLPKSLKKPRLRHLCYHENDMGEKNHILRCQLNMD